MIRRPGVGLARRGDLRGTGAGGGLSLLTLPTTDLLLHLDARTGVTEGATFTWADQSGNGPDATQGTGANQPSVETNGTLGTVVRFNGTTDWLDVTGLASADENWTVFAVLDSGSNGTNQSILDAQTGRAALQVTNAFGSVGLFDVGSRLLGADATGVQVLTWRQATGEGIKAYRSATEIGSSASAGNSLGGTAYIGANFLGTGAYVDADVAALFAYDAGLDADGRAAVLAYILQEWGV